MCTWHTEFQGRFDSCLRERDRGQEVQFQRAMLTEPIADTGKSVLTHSGSIIVTAYIRVLRQSNGRTESCEICLDDIEPDDKSVVTCTNAHRICPECFPSFLDSEFSSDIGLLTERGSRLAVCPAHGCNYAYSDMQIMACGPETIDKWKRVNRKLGEWDALFQVGEI